MSFGDIDGRPVALGDFPAVMAPWRFKGACLLALRPTGAEHGIFIGVFTSPDEVMELIGKVSQLIGGEMRQGEAFDLPGLADCSYIAAKGLIDLNFAERLVATTVLNLNLGIAMDVSIKSMASSWTGRVFRPASSSSESGARSDKTRGYEIGTGRAMPNGSGSARRVVEAKAIMGDIKRVPKAAAIAARLGQSAPVVRTLIRVSATTTAMLASDDVSRKFKPGRLVSELRFARASLGRG